MSVSVKKKFIMSLIFFMSLSGFVFGQDSAPDSAAIDTLQNNLNIVWTCVAAFLVFFYAGWFCHGGKRFYTSQEYH